MSDTASEITRLRAALAAETVRAQSAETELAQALALASCSEAMIQTVREKFTCRACEKISQPPTPFHTIPRGWAGPHLIAMVAFEKYGQHQPLNRQSERFVREGVDISLSALADLIGHHSRASRACSTHPEAAGSRRSARPTRRTDDSAAGPESSVARSERQLPPSPCHGACVAVRAEWQCHNAPPSRHRSGSAPDQTGRP